MALHDISGRTLLFEDNFASFNSENWGFELGRVRNNELQYYTNDGSNIEITADNELCITAKRVNHVNAEWTSASLTSFGKKEFQYGRFEARIKFPQIEGAFPAFWTLGNSYVMHYYDDGTWMTTDSGTWPYCGENDIIEHYSGSSSQVTCGAFYSATPDGTKVEVGRVYQTIDMSEYHIYACEWTASQITYYIDGIQWSTFPITSDMDYSFRNPHFMILNLAVGSSGGTSITSTDEMKMYVDWVRVYAPLDENGSARIRKK